MATQLPLIGYTWNWVLIHVENGYLAVFGNLFTYHHPILTEAILDHPMLVNRLGYMNALIYMNHINFSCADERKMSFLSLELGDGSTSIIAQ